MKHLFKLMTIIAILAFITACSTSNDIKDSTESVKISDSYRYQLPVIFHIFYNNTNEDSTKAVFTPERIAFILKNVNDLYKGTYNTNSVDINIDFVLAPKNENGDSLKNPGIDYVQWSNNSIDVEKFMDDNNNNYTKYIWDPNNYINVMLFPFKNTSNDESVVTLGITDLPYTTSGTNQLSGLVTVKYTSMNKSNLEFPYCSAINALFASSNYDSNRYTATDAKGFYYCNADVSATLAHELGHYLGLHHVFTEDANGNILNSCDDTDYCEDTPSYNRIGYVTWENHYRLTHQDPSLDELDIRQNCSDSTFHASNLMDYYDCTNDLFTKDQRDRMRHVLYYSPLIPGPKKVSTRAIETRAAGDQPLDLPVMIRK
jgi:zinc-dependent metalloproteinase lipoprotein